MTRELHIWVKPIGKLYTDDTGQFLVRSHSGNQYLMVAYHCDTNAILIETLQTREDHHRIPAYTRIMTCLKNRVHVVDQQVLENEASRNTADTSLTYGKPHTNLCPPMSN